MQYLIVAFLAVNACYAVYRAVGKPGDPRLTLRQRRAFSGFELVRATFLLAAAAPLLLIEDAFAPDRIDRTFNILLGTVSVMAILLGAYIFAFAKDFVTPGAAAKAWMPSIFKPSPRNNRIMGVVIVLFGVLLLLDASMPRGA